MLCVCRVREGATLNERSIDPVAESEVVDPELVDQLLAQADDADLELLGPDGLLSQVTKAVLERALDEELTDHLGYERGDPAGRGSGNSRNGSSSKTVLTDIGAVDVEIPRDRTGEFEPKLISKHQTRLGGFNERIIALYARGLSTRQIQSHLAEMYQVDVSPDLISRVTDAVVDEITEWQNRPLDAVYPILFIDALVIKVRDGGMVRNKAVHIVIGVDVEGRKQVLGMWLQNTEGAKFWMQVFTELRNRGVRDVVFVVCDGLRGLPDSVEAIWPDAVVQTCVVHLIRGSLRYGSYKDRKKLATALRPIYEAPSIDAAADALDRFEVEWGDQYGGIVALWRKSWTQFTPFLAFPPDIRRVIYTTNMIESLNAQLRKVTRNRGHFPTDQAAIKVLYLAIRNIERKGGTSTYKWKPALNAFAVHFPGRLPTT